MDRNRIPGGGDGGDQGGEDHPYADRVDNVYYLPKRKRSTALLISVGVTVGLLLMPVLWVGISVFLGYLTYRFMRGYEETSE